mmetsp:Transcript_129494/g.415066  ORF Transcript_129494/g.415066 Transcript_129494/m.415066 type:complete len:207 (-) Transcript_129494:14-634(-)
MCGFVVVQNIKEQARITTAEQLSEVLDWRKRRAVHRWHAHSAQRNKAGWFEEAELPRKDGAPVVTHEQTTFAPQLLPQQRHHVRAQRRAVEGLAPPRRVRGPEASHVGRYGSEAVPREEKHLVPPREPRFGPAVQQQHHGAGLGARRRDAKAHAIDADEAQLDAQHGRHEDVTIVGHGVDSRTTRILDSTLTSLSQVVRLHEVANP